MWALLKLFLKVSTINFYIFQQFWVPYNIKRSCSKMKDKNQENDLDATNPIREKLKDRHSVDFSSATRRRLALLYQKRDE
jgi:hypothetical protein